MSNWKLGFAVMTGMGVWLLARGGTIGPLTASFRIAVLLTGVIGFIVVSIRESRRGERGMTAREPEGVDRVREPPRIPIGRLLLVLGILPAVGAGLLALAQFVSSEAQPLAPPGR